VLLGDGEINEGQVWEAAKTAAHLRLDNLVAMVDVNCYQNDGPTEKEMSMEPLDDKWRAFGWNTLRTNGHDASKVLEAFDQVPIKNGRPTVILFDTVKCKGVSFMEKDKVRYHGAAPDNKQLEQALRELQEAGCP
jgi:transketolase